MGIQTQLLNTVGSVGGIGNAASTLASVLTGAPSTWQATIRQASFRGIPFAVLAADTAFGRRKAVHRYPQRDGVWSEDLGREARLYHVEGFLLENDAVYHGGPVLGQRDRIIRAFEMPEDGELVHPTLGRVYVSGLQAQCRERWDAGRYFELKLTFIEAGEQRFPQIGASTGNLLTQALGALGLSNVADFLAKTAGILQYGASIISTSVSMALSWYTQALGLIHDVKRFYGSISTLVNSVEALFSGDSTSTTTLANPRSSKSVVAGSFGRYFGGANAGYSATTAQRIAPTTVAQLIANDAAARTALDTAGNYVERDRQRDRRHADGDNQAIQPGGAGLARRGVEHVSTDLAGGRGRGLRSDHADFRRRHHRRGQHRER